MQSAFVAAAALTMLLESATAAGADWVVAGFLGAAATRSTTLRIEQPSRDTLLEARDVAFAGHAFESPVYYGYRVMWAGPHERRIGFEAELIHLKVYADTAAPVRLRGTLAGSSVDRIVPLGDVVERFSISHGLNLLFANVVLRHSIGGAGTLQSHRPVLAIRAGGGPTLPHAESTIGGRTQEQYEWGRVAGQVAAGLEYRVTRHAAVLAEYKVTGTSQRVAVADGTASARFVSQHLVAGLAWRF
jgi:opacity protein-like surface antigen